MGTMRSGHYEACVQRGLSLADSPAVKDLLRKHGIAVSEDADAASSDKPSNRPLKAAGKTNKVVSAATRDAQAKAQAAVSSSDAGKEGKAQDVHSTAAADAQAHAITNGKGNAVPEDWEGSDSSSARGFGSNQSPKIGDSHVGPLPAESNESEVDTALSETEATAAQVSAKCAATECFGTTQNEEDDKPVLESKTGASQVSKDLPRTWYCISDAHVRAISEADVLSREAYILMYMRVA